MLTAEKLAARAWRRLQQLGAGVAVRAGYMSELQTRFGDRAPLSGLAWAELYAASRVDHRSSRRRRAIRKQLAAELAEALDRWFVRAKVESMDKLEQLGRQWEREDAQRADEQLVAEVAARRAAAAARAA